MPPSKTDRELVTEHVLRCVEQIPAGRVASYGTVAEVVGIGPRQVGSIMRHFGRDVPWWRVTNHAGDFSPGLLERALEHWQDEGIKLKPNGRGCRYSRFGADVAALADAYRTAAADLPPL